MIESKYGGKSLFYLIVHPKGKSRHELMQRPWGSADERLALHALPSLLACIAPDYQVQGQRPLLWEGHSNVNH